MSGFVTTTSTEFISSASTTSAWWSSGASSNAMSRNALSRLPASLSLSRLPSLLLGSAGASETICGKHVPGVTQSSTWKRCTPSFSAMLSGRCTNAASMCSRLATTSGRFSSLRTHRRPAPAIAAPVSATLIAPSASDAFTSMYSGGGFTTTSSALYPTIA